MREPAQRKGRVCIRPEISRTYTFGLRTCFARSRLDSNAHTWLAVVFGVQPAALFYFGKTVLCKRGDGKVVGLQAAREAWAHGRRLCLPHNTQ